MHIGQFVMEFLYQIFIYPVQFLVEVIYLTLYHAFEQIQGRSGFAIIGVSAAVSFLTHPLYMKAELLQDAHRKLMNKMAPRVESIKRNFSGDKKYMLLDAYYRKNKYHPFMALRSLLSLLIMIPFFLAAYIFLSTPGLLDGESFFILKDLAKEDALLKIGRFEVNFLPVLMTLINIAAGYVYSFRFTKSETVQTYCSALIFLILLYNSPSGLVLYWTCNNIFSLCKNLWLRYGLKCSYVSYLSQFIDNYCPSFTSSPGLTDSLFISSSIFLWLLSGIVLPFNMAASSAVEFCDLLGGYSVWSLLSYPVLQSFGIFLVWGSLVYFMSARKTRNLLSLLFCAFSLIAIINIYRYDAGTMSQALRLNPSELTMSIPTSWLLTCFLTIVLCVLFYFIIKFGHIKAIMSAFFILIIACAINVGVKAQDIYAGNLRYLEITRKESDVLKSPSVFKLTKTGKNVVIIFLDKAISAYFPLILYSNPELNEKLSGFVYYPDTASFYAHTILSVPSIFGGYEYTPDKLDARLGQKMKDKHNESLLVLPVMFKNAGGEVSVADSPLKNYEWVSDNDLFSDFGITGVNISGEFTQKFLSEELDITLPQFMHSALLRHDFLIYSFMKMSPEALNRRLYNSGKYLNTVYISSKNKIPGENMSMLDAYSSLFYLSFLTDATSPSSLTLNIISNELTHEPSFLQYPGYKAALEVTDKGPNIVGSEDAFKHYHVNASALLLLSSWFDFLREQGVYDNTKIIIISDHGAFLPTWASKESLSTYYNPLFLVKDFGSSGPVRTSEDFMTTADVPYLALRGVEVGFVNPFTGNLISDSVKAGGIYIVPGNKHNPQDFQGDRCIFSEYLIKVTKDILDISHWKLERVEK